MTFDNQQYTDHLKFAERVIKDHKIIFNKYDLVHSSYEIYWSTGRNRAIDSIILDQLYKEVRYSNIVVSFRHFENGTPSQKRAIVTTSKMCIRCQDEKPLAAFRTRKDTRSAPPMVYSSTICRLCENELRSRKSIKNVLLLEQIRANDRRYYHVKLKTDANKVQKHRERSKQRYHLIKNTEEEKERQRCKQRTHYQTIKNDPEFQKKNRERAKQYYQKMKNNEQAKERERLRANARYQKMKNDPAFKKKSQERYQRKINNEQEKEKRSPKRERTQSPIDTLIIEKGE